MTTNAELAVLSLVVERPRHGYDIEQTIVERNMRDWTDVGFSSIYYLLEKLEAAGLVTSYREQVPGRGPARRIFAPTPEGTATLHREALTALAGPARRPTSFQLGLAVLPQLDPDEVATALGRHEADLMTQLDLLATRRGVEPPLHVAAMFDLAETQIRAELTWIRRFAAELQPTQQAERTLP